jgi:2-C-methyl-D-erythritol 4-phosphate cytidylyltransferase
MVNNLKVVIAAAGISSRMKGLTNKPYLLLNSRPILTYSLDVFEECSQVDEIIITANPKEIEYCKNEIVQRFGYNKVRKVISGGKQRQDSVWNGLKSLEGEADFVAIHDGARPLLTLELFSMVLAAAEKWGAAVPAVAVHDTLKAIDNNGFIDCTLDRSRIMAVQTPQIFNYNKLMEAYKKAYEEEFASTDDASIFEKYCNRVKIVTGDNKNIKITTPEDLITAEGFLNRG